MFDLDSSAMMTHWLKASLQDTEAVPVLGLSGIPIKEGRSSGSRRFTAEKDRRKELERKNRQEKGTETDGRAKPHQKGEKRYRV